MFDKRHRSNKDYYNMDYKFHNWFQSIPVDMCMYKFDHLDLLDKLPHSDMDYFDMGCMFDSYFLSSRIHIDKYTMQNYLSQLFDKYHHSNKEIVCKHFEIVHS